MPFFQLARKDPTWNGQATFMAERAAQLEEEGQLEEAWKEYETLTALPSTGGLQLAQAARFAAAYGSDEAEALFAKAAAKAGSNDEKEEIHRLAGWSMLDLGAYARAAEEFEYAKKLTNADELESRLLVGLAASAWLSNETDAAMAHFKPLVEKDAKSWLDPGHIAALPHSAPVKEALMSILDLRHQEVVPKSGSPNGKMEVVVFRESRQIYYGIWDKWKKQLLHRIPSTYTPEDVDAGFSDADWQRSLGVSVIWRSDSAYVALNEADYDRNGGVILILTKERNYDTHFRWDALLQKYTRLEWIEGRSTDLKWSGGNQAVFTLNGKVRSAETGAIDEVQHIVTLDLTTELPVATDAR